MFLTGTIMIVASAVFAILCSILKLSVGYFIAALAAVVIGFVIQMIGLSKNRPRYKWPK